MARMSRRPWAGCLETRGHWVRPVEALRPLHGRQRRHWRRSLGTEGHGLVPLVFLLPFLDNLFLFVPGVGFFHHCPKRCLGQAQLARCFAGINIDIFCAQTKLLAAEG